MRIAEVRTTRRRTIRVYRSRTAGTKHKKASANGPLELRRRLEARRAPSRDVHGLASARVLSIARLAPRDAEGAEADEGDGLAALEGAANRGEERAQGTVGGGLGPAALAGHGDHEVRPRHEGSRRVIICRGRMLAEVARHGQAARPRGAIVEAS